MVALAFFILALGCVLVWLLNQRLRRRLLVSVMSDGFLGWLSPLVLAGFAFVFAASVFSVATFLLNDWGVLPLSAPSCTTDCPLAVEDVWNFYIWHFLGAIPLLDVNDSLQWNAPLVYSGALAGWMVIAFKAAVIVPLIGAIREYWQVRKETPRIRIRPWSPARVVRAGRSVKISWTSAPPPAEFVFVVEVKCPGPPGKADTSITGSTYPSRKKVEITCSGTPRDTADAKAPEWETLVTDTPDTKGEFELTRPGKYRFRATCGSPGTATLEEQAAILEALGGRPSLQSRELVIVVRPTLPDPLPLKPRSNHK